MATTYAFQVLDAVLSTLRATTGYRDPAVDSTSIPVYDGPEITLGEGVPQEDFLVIGWAGGMDAADQALELGSTTQQPASMGTTRQRQEDGRISCVACAQTGDSELGQAKAMRDAALSYVAAVETAIRNDPWLGITGARGLVIEFAGVTSVQQLASENGTACWLEFEITYTALI